MKKVVHLKHPLLLCKRSNVLNTVNNCHECTDVQVNEYLKIQKDIKAKFKTGRGQLLMEISSGRKRIAVHVRRGDVGENKNASRFTRLENVSNLLDDIILFCNKNNIPFWIDLYSEGTLADFDELTSYPIRWHLNEDPQSTFQALVSAETLIMAKSPLSYAAALITDGLVFYDKFWHPPLHFWAVIESIQEQRWESLNNFIRTDKQQQESPTR